MIYTVALGVGLILTILASPSTPVKMSFTLVTLSMILFIQLLAASSSVWAGSIFFMIFIGGIMIMFMILSSLLPNEKNMKPKKILFFSFVVSFLTVFLVKKSDQVESGFNQESKVVFLSNQSFETLMLVILLYFLSFVYIISKQTSSLRSFVCQHY